MQALREDAARRIAEGDELEIVEPDRLRGVLGTNAYHGGMIDRRSGLLHPLNLLHRRSARGRKPRRQDLSSKVRVIACEGGAKPERAHGVGPRRVRLRSFWRDISKPSSAGACPASSFRPAATSSRPSRSTNSTVRRLNPQDLAVADSNVVLDYFRFSADRRMLFGGRANYSNRDPKDLVTAMRPRILRIFPELKDAAIDYAWGGKIDIVLTRAPAIGRLEPNVYFMQGYSGHGVNVTHIAADIVADAIGGSTGRFDLFDGIRQIRLPVGPFVGSQLLALGMLYYRLRDWL